VRALVLLFTLAAAAGAAPRIETIDRATARRMLALARRAVRAGQGATARTIFERIDGIHVRPRLEGAAKRLRPARRRWRALARTRLEPEPEGTIRIPGQTRPRPAWTIEGTTVSGALPAGDTIAIARFVPGAHDQQTTFFSSTDRIAIAGVPVQTPGQRKATKEEYLAYLRSVAQAFDLEVRTFTEVLSIAREGDGFLARTRDPSGESSLRCERVVLATGDMARPRLLGIEGEDLPHVSHYFDDAHLYFRRRLLVVGGKNSAVEAALRCWHAGADVTISYRGAAFDEKAVKYWLRPELLGRIGRGEIACHYATVPVSITPTHVVLRGGDGEPAVEADAVLLMTGYVADPSLFASAGAALEGDRPVFDEKTMETTVPGLYVAGTASAGTQLRYRLFIENCHIHAKRIAAHVADEPPPPDPQPLRSPES